MRLTLTLGCLAAAMFGVPAPLLAQYDKTPPINIADAVAATPADMKPYTEPLEHTSFRIEMVPIPAGTFTMGSPASEAGRRDDEGPQHAVQIAPFWMSRHEITWNQYKSGATASIRSAAPLTTNRQPPATKSPTLSLDQPHPTPT